jgi:hypothetical protein
MSYITVFGEELTSKLESGTESMAETVSWVGQKMVESYKKGITAGQKGATVKRQGASRSSGFVRKAA